MEHKRNFRHLSVLLFLILSIATMLFGGRYSTEVSQVTVTRLKRKVIVITTFMRSGSTFLGELFNLHPETFYQFEPLHPFYHSGCDQQLDEKYQALLDRLRCTFHDEYNTTGIYTSASGLEIPWQNLKRHFQPTGKVLLMSSIRTTKYRGKETFFFDPNLVVFARPHSVKKTTPTIW